MEENKISHISNVIENINIEMLKEFYKMAWDDGYYVMARSEYPGNFDDEIKGFDVIIEELYNKHIKNKK